MEGEKRGIDFQKPTSYNHSVGGELGRYRDNHLQGVEWLELGRAQHTLFKIHPIFSPTLCIAVAAPRGVSRGWHSGHTG